MPMTKEVLVTISGLHYDENVMSRDDQEPIEVITPAEYYYKNGKHYVLFEELAEGRSGSIRNKIKIKEGEMLEVIKTGITNTQMLFEKGRMHVTNYKTAYGELVVGTYTKEFDVQSGEDLIAVYVRYSLDVGGEEIAECEIHIKIEAKSGTGY